ncbi:MAG: PTS-dependent dihydroxyacetone kinase phosphotransferase subunit DhaM [Lachnospiraceae bacterium]|nr:PTS-dependent dihydroxyacetone kinase phosphotransferase subunit DhaM [Lachnospiraceae bacterium]
MVGLVIVSHSPKIAEGVRDLANEVARASGLIVAAGGLEDGSIGTDAMRILDAIQEANQGDGVAILCDLGSAIMSAEIALEFLGNDVAAKIVDAPLVEGAVAAAVEASCGSSLEDVIGAAEAVRGEKKIL